MRYCPVLIIYFLVQRLILAQVLKIPRPQPFPLYLDGVWSCCDVGSEEDLAGCVSNASSSMEPRKALSADVSILTYVTDKAEGHFAVPEIWSFAKYMIAATAAYAEHNGYAFQLLTDEDVVWRREKDVRWSKIALIQNALDPEFGWARGCKFAVWIDADAIILDFGMRVEAIGEQYPEAHLIISADIRQGFVNSGFMIFRNTKWTLRFLSRWWNAVDRDVKCDQDAFDVVFAQLTAEAGSGMMVPEIAILARDAINTDPPAAVHLNPHNQVLHLMGEDSAMRRATFQRGFSSICLAKPGVPLSNQLGLSRIMLQSLALETYRHEILAQINELSDFSQSPFEALVSGRVEKAFEALSRAAHHYSDVLGAQSNQIFSGENVVIRHKVFTLAQNWTDLVRSEIGNAKGENESNSRRLSGTLVALLKRSAEAGNDEFSALVKVDDKRAAARIVLGILDELVVRLAPESHPIALHMKALMHQNLGMLNYELLNSKDAEADRQTLLGDARKNLEASVSIFDEIYPQMRPSDKSAAGEHTLSMQLLSSVLCQQNDFSAGLSLWTKTVEKARQTAGGIRLGKPWGALAEALYNSAVCHFQGGEMLEARRLLDESMKMATELVEQGDEHHARLLALCTSLAEKLPTSRLETLNVDEWEECEPNEDGCLAFDVPLHQGYEEIIGMPKEGDEVNEARRQHLSRATRFTRNLSRKKQNHLICPDGDVMEAQRQWSQQSALRLFAPSDRIMEEEVQKLKKMLVEIQRRIALLEQSM